MDKKPCLKCKKPILSGIRFCPFCGAEQKVKKSSSTFDKNPFEILQVTPYAEEEVISAAYKSLAKKYHPDTLKNGTSEERMKELNWAFGELSDPQKRKKWAQGEQPTPQKPKVPKTEPTPTPKESPDPFGNWSYQGSSSSYTSNKKTKEPKVKDDKPPAKPQTTETVGKSSTIRPKDSLNMNTKVIGAIAIGFISLVCLLSIIEANSSKPTSSIAENNLPLSTATKHTSNTRTTTPAQDWLLVFHDEFNLNENDWKTEKDYDNEYGTDQSILNNGRLSWSGEAHEGFQAFRYPDIDTFTNFKVSVDTKIISGELNTNNHGIFFRANDSGAYSFLISDQYFAVFAFFTDDEDITLIDWTRDSSIHLSEQNNLSIIANGIKFTFLINGKTVATITDNNHSSGFIGLEFGINEPGAEVIVEFDNLKIWVPGNQSSRISTSTSIPIVKGCVNISSLNIREGPSLGYSVIDSIQYGYCLYLTEVTLDMAWGNSSKGWVFLEYIDINSGSIDQLPKSNVYGISVDSTPVSTNVNPSQNPTKTSVPINTQTNPTFTSIPPSNTPPPPAPTYTPACPIDDPNWPCHD